MKNEIKKHLCEECKYFRKGKAVSHDHCNYFWNFDWQDPTANGRNGYKCYKYEKQK